MYHLSYTVQSLRDPDGERGLGQISKISDRTKMGQDERKAFLSFCLIICKTSHGGLVFYGTAFHSLPGTEIQAEVWIVERKELNCGQKKNEMAVDKQSSTE